MAKIDRTRNIGIVAHIDAGKTTVSERFLHHSGMIHRVGEVHDGQAQMDWMPEERERGITITAAATSFEWDGHEIHLIDTPGHVDFTIEVERSLRVLDAAVVVFCGVGGVEPQSETVWRQADKFHVPRLAFINKMDRTGANFDQVLEQVRRDLHAPAVPIQRPVGVEDSFVGAIDLVRMQFIRFGEELGVPDELLPIPEEQRSAADAGRQVLIEALADIDDAVAELYLDEREPDEKLLRAAIRRGTLQRTIVPVLCGAALRNKGIRPLLDAVVAYLPSPEDLPPVAGIDPTTEQPTSRRPKDKEPFSALAFKVTMDEGRKGVFLRIFSGTLAAGDDVYNPRLGATEKVARLFVVHADRRKRIESAGAGSIVAATGLKHVTTGDTICAADAPVIFERIDTYEPVISVAIEPKTQAAKKKLDLALEKMTEEDPTFRVREDPETGQTLISGMGELHLQIIVERLRREYATEVAVGKPQVVFRETIGGSAEESAEFSRALKDATLFGKVRCRVAPRPRGSGIKLLSVVDEQSLPPAVFEAARSGLAEATETGPDGYRMEDVEATLVAVEYREEAQPEIGVKVAAGEAFRRAVQAAGAFRLEPIMRVEVTVPEEHLGSVIADLKQRRASIFDLGTHHDRRLAKAYVPLRQMFGYSTDLRSLTKGRATFAMEFHTFDNLIEGQPA